MQTFDTLCHDMGERYEVIGNVLFYAVYVVYCLVYY